jgi:hypothetical protein
MHDFIIVLLFFYVILKYREHTSNGLQFLSLHFVLWPWKWPSWLFRAHWKSRCILLSLHGKATELARSSCSEGSLRSFIPSWLSITLFHQWQREAQWRPLQTWLWTWLFVFLVVRFPCVLWDLLHLCRFIYYAFLLLTLFFACLLAYFYLVWFLVGLGFELRALTNTLPLESCPNPFFFFCFSYFSDRVPHFCPGPGSDCDPLTYSFPRGWDHRCTPSHLGSH